ncbi:MAG: YkgJ family cysteine cluster protein [Solirubrobacterales bacterium]
MGIVPKVRVYIAAEDGKLGLGVEVADKAASLGDLLEAWEPLASDSRLEKMYAGEDGACKGCVNNCCNAAFVIPDLISFKALCQATAGSPREFLANHFEPVWLANGLARLKTGPCTFLNDRVCTVYPVRSLICRFYLCSHILGDTEELVYAIVTSGVTATIRYLEQEGLLTGRRGLTGYDRALIELIESAGDWPGTEAFLNAETYYDIPLKHFLKETSPS